MSELTPRERENLTHCLGYNYTPRQVRNQYLAENGTADWAICDGLVKRGLMVNRGGFDLGVPETLFAATPEGEALVKPKPHKQTRAQRRYDRYLDIREVCPDMKFIDFCKREREFYP